MGRRWVRGTDEKANPMSSWVISSNPKTYNTEDSLAANDKIMDWVTNNNFEVGDTIYVYEVIPPRGRGRIVYETTVIKTDLSFGEKLNDREFWAGHVYPKDIAKAKFSRLKLATELNSDGLSLKALKEHGFTAPQGHAHLLDNSPDLLAYIESRFSL